jgi:hypothetical protein
MELGSGYYPHFGDGFAYSGLFDLFYPRQDDFILPIVIFVAIKNLSGPV